MPSVALRRTQDPGSTLGFLDTFQLDSAARNRTFATLAQSASRLLEVGELESRIEARESALRSRQ
jgi:hypothetical protein